MVTRQRDPDAEVTAWRERRTARIEQQREVAAAMEREQPRRRRWRGRRR
jgi:hypothetical protein